MRTCSAETVCCANGAGMKKGSCRKRWDDLMEDMLQVLFVVPRIRILCTRLVWLVDPCKTIRSILQTCNCFTFGTVCGSDCCTPMDRHALVALVGYFYFQRGGVCCWFVSNVFLECISQRWNDQKVWNSKSCRETKEKR